MRTNHEAITTRFLEAVASVTPQNIDRHAEGGWSARQVSHHMADSEA